jgi:hypothetical protein
MNKDFEMDGIDWTGKGYFGCPHPPPASKLPKDLMAEPWVLWLVAFDRAKKNDFTLMTGVIPLCKQTKDPVLGQSASYLLGDAGTSTCFQTIIEELNTADNPGVILDFCRALHFRGRLSDVPVILRAYERIATFDDADIIPVWLSNLLESEDDMLSESEQFDDFNGYSASVMDRYQQLSNDFGMDQILVFRGEKFGVLALAKYILHRVREPFVRSELRHRFEAATGIDCSRFYKRGELQPLQAAATVEDFLESPEAAKYQDGVRYFFGHRIPD